MVTLNTPLEQDKGACSLLVEGEVVGKAKKHGKGTQKKKKGFEGPKI